jgi:hypothetical protein
MKLSSVSLPDSSVYGSAHKIISLMDFQAKVLLPTVFAVFIALSIYTSINPVCNEVYVISQYVKLMHFSCVVCFATFGTVQITQICYFFHLKDNMPLIKICLSNLLMCAIAGTSHFLAFLFDAGGICIDGFGYI